jgi:hypothetical protein
MMLTLLHGGLGLLDSAWVQTKLESCNATHDNTRSPDRAATHCKRWHLEKVVDLHRILLRQDSYYAMQELEEITVGLIVRC